jgi:DNA-binding response OmpR family regulator
MTDIRTKVNVFCGKKLLLVEDDRTFREGRLVKHYCDAGVREKDIAWKNCAEEALEELLKSCATYDLIVIDIMLPQTKEDVKMIEEINADLRRLRDITRKEGQVDKNDKEAISALHAAYERRPVLLSLIQSLISDREGLEVLKKWKAACNRSEHYPPFLFMTCVGNQAVIDEGMSLVEGHGEWMVKPVTVEDLLHTSARLIEEGKRCLWTP